MSNKKEGFLKEIYGPETKTVTQTDQCAVYKMENETGEGIITRYQVFSGIELMYNDFHMDGCNHNKLPCENIMEINHCREGRFECEFFDGSYTYLGEGDLAVNMLTNRTSAATFPLVHYHGISIVIHIPEAAEIINKVSETLGSISIDLYEIQRKLCSGNRCSVIRAQESIQHIFSELYTAPDQLKSAYFKLKVMELLLFLSTPDLIMEPEEKHYFYKDQITKVKMICSFMIEHIDNHYTLEALSKQFDIPLTSMKACFKAVYGSSVYTYMRTYRLHTAAMLLRETEENITFISGRIGYGNASKFSEAFKKELGYSPSEYRKKYLSKRSEDRPLGVAENLK